jgi:MerR family transcriptional regulator/heat shock protein HspR
MVRIERLDARESRLAVFFGLTGQTAMATKRKSKGAYMISAVAEMYDIHPQTLRLYEREGLLLPSRSEGNTRLYTDEDLERLEFILNLARDLGVNIAGIAIVLQMRERMEEMNRQMQGFVDYVRTEMLSRMQQQQPGAGLVPVSRPAIVPRVMPAARPVQVKVPVAAGKPASRGTKAK